MGQKCPQTNGQAPNIPQIFSQVFSQIFPKYFQIFFQPLSKYFPSTESFENHVISGMIPEMTPQQSLIVDDFPLI